VRRRTKDGDEKFRQMILAENWDDFSALVEKFVDDSHVLQTTLSETDDPKALRVAFFKATKSCSSCHKQFRRPKD